MASSRRPPAVLAGSLLVVAAIVTGPLVAQPERPPVVVERATTEVPEAELLDVGIQVFDPGLPPGTDVMLEEKGIFADVRRSEARYMPVLLASTLQETGFWGAVRVVPAGVSTLEVTVTGRVLKSTGLRLELEIAAHDVTGRPWLAKRYKRLADPDGYDRSGLQVVDPFQDLYNEIANDLLAARRKSQRFLSEVRRVSDLRFAADLAPEAFGDHLERNRKGRYVVDRLPADGDPMLERLARIRERDYLLVDSLHQYYLDFRGRMETPYVDWRMFSYEEEVALRRLNRQKWAERVGGIVAILGGVLAEGDSRATGAARQGAIIAGELLLRDSFAKGAEAKIHRAAINELAASFEAEVEPLVLEVEGETLRLTGSAETQYAEWRRLLAEMWREEVGVPRDPNTGEPVVAEPVPARAEPPADGRIETAVDGASGERDGASGG